LPGILLPANQQCGCCYLGIPSFSWPVARVEVSGRLKGFECGGQFYSFQSDEGRVLRHLMSDAPLRIETENPTLVAESHLSGEQFRFDPIRGRGLGFLTDSYFEVRSARPDRVVLTLNKSGINPYIRSTRISTVAQPGEDRERLSWSPPQTVSEDGMPLPSCIYVPDDQVFGSTADRSQRVARFEFHVTLWMTDSAATYLANSYYRPLVSNALRRACELAARGDNKAAADSFVSAGGKYRRLQELVRDADRDAVIDDSFDIAERLIKGERSRQQQSVTPELLAAARDLLAAQATYKAREYDLKNNTPTADIQRKAEELQRFITMILVPATTRYGTAVENFLAVSSAEELYDLSLRYGFSSLLR
jgi:hypothetical protein